MGLRGPERQLGRPRLKKKDLTETPEPDFRGESVPRENKFRSAFDGHSDLLKQAPAVFLPPEAFHSGASLSEDDVMLDLQSASAWDVATRYHEFKGRAGLRRSTEALRRLSAEAILDRARALIGSVVHPTDQRVSPWSELPADAIDAELDLDETFEQSPLAALRAQGLTPDAVWMSYRSPRRHSVILSVDTSLSMTGEKLALTAVALAVVLLQFPEDRIGIVAFENEAKILKHPDERISIPELVERFLDVPAQGYTHLEEGMRATLSMLKEIPQGRAIRPASVVLLTDGKYTAGRDPAYLAPRFPHLLLLKMGTERASLELCREMARKGHGRLQEVGQLETLPAVMHGVVKDLLRGRSLE